MAALEPDDPGSVGDYRLLSRLGAGGMGQVFLGRSPGGRLVAVKVVHAELLRRPEFRSRFRREVEAARLVSGAFTAPVIDADPDAPLPWLVTSYIAGPSLEQAVAERGPMDAGAVRALAAGLAEALVSIHAVNLVHRDLKPSNVLLAEDGPRVIDFGIVRSVEADSITRTGHMAGSPGFMSPEQVNGEPVTPAADVFCLGAVLAFAATGDNPFGGGPTPALLYRVVHNEPQVDRIADPALRSLIAACLAKAPGDRPTPREILARIGPVDGETATTRLRPIRPQPAPAATPAAATLYPQAPPATDRPTRPATRLDTTSPPPGPLGTPTAPGAHGGGTRGTRRAFLLAGVGAVAAAGTGAAFWFGRSMVGAEDTDEGPRRAPAPGGASPSATARPQASAIGVWPLDETSGTLARDTAGGDNGTATGVGWRSGKDGAAEFDGKTSQIVTAGPVLRTGAGQGFTVSAWVCLSAVPGFFATAVSQEETPGDSGDSGFFLQYSSEDNRWAFSRPGVRAVGYTVPAAATWTHLAGVCDGAAGKLRLYVDGVQEAAITDTHPTAATGSLVIGRAKFGGKPSDFFPGAIKDVRVFDRALTPARIKNLP
ncbi:LamG-like jellyroll fold domain-containing protein [Streptomyces sp. NPDC046915]|uniref:protein kinase domain-containing protein n=1 Tax=Streptomyces sp. NPDC046915 TaxID=3155257 RepID=UPI0033EB958F